MSTEPRFCEHCGVAMYRKPREKFAAFERRRFCSYACKDRHRAEAAAHRVCLECGKGFYRDRREANSWWKRNFCTDSCYKQALQAGRATGPVPRERKPGEPAKVYPKRCRSCGKSFKTTDAQAMFCTEECAKRHSALSEAMQRFLAFVVDA